MWQQLYSELKDKNFMVVAVAEESRGTDHARPWIEQAKSDYWQLIDTEHRLEDLYNLVNVPQAIWIDEKGTIVRPPETAGSTDHFRRMDLKTRTMSPKDQEERLAARVAYLDACAHHGATLQKRRRPVRPGLKIAEARTRWLRRPAPHGRAAEGDRLMKRAAYIPSHGAGRPPTTRSARRPPLKRVQALGDKPYHPPPKLLRGSRCACRGVILERHAPTGLLARRSS